MQHPIDELKQIPGQLSIKIVFVSAADWVHQLHSAHDLLRNSIFSAPFNRVFVAFYYEKVNIEIVTVDKCRYPPTK